MSNPSQNFVDIKEIRDGIVILRGGGLRGVLMTSSVNIALKSADEQRAIITQFQSFLNTLEFSVQIVMQSRHLDIRPYIQTLEERVAVQEEELLRVQTEEYIEFIKLFTDQVNVMTKNFFVVVPYDSAVISTKSGLLGKLRGGSKKTSGDTEAFEQKRTQLEQRIGLVQQGLNRLGIRVEQLQTEQVIELFHNVYNPGDTYREAVLGKDSARQE